MFLNLSFFSALLVISNYACLSLPYLHHAISLSCRSLSPSVSLCLGANVCSSAGRLERAPTLPVNEGAPRGSLQASSPPRSDTASSSGSPFNSHVQNFLFIIFRTFSPPLAVALHGLSLGPSPLPPPRPHLFFSPKPFFLLHVIFFFSPAVRFPGKLPRFRHCHLSFYIFPVSSSQAFSLLLIMSKTPLFFYSHLYKFVVPCSHNPLSH